MKEIFIGNDEFLSDPAGAAWQTEKGIVFIGELGRRSFVLMSFEIYRALPGVDAAEESRWGMEGQPPPDTLIDERNRLWRESLPEGWHAIYDRLVDEFTTMHPRPIVVQAKEKLGGLRVYLDRPHREAQVLINTAMRQAERSCQFCGEPGQPHNAGGYLATLCPGHADGAAIG
jgi:hypothetical protein